MATKSNRKIWIFGFAFPTIVTLCGIVMIGIQLRQERLNDDLAEAIQKNDTRRVLASLKSGADANRRVSTRQRRDLLTMVQDMFRGKLTFSDADAPSVLSMAVSNNNTAVVRALLDHNAKGVNEDAEFVGWEGASPDKIPMLLVALKKKNSEVVLALLDHHADIRVKDRNGSGVALECSNFFPDNYFKGEAPLHYLRARETSLQILKEMVRHGANPLETNDMGETILARAANSDLNEMAGYLLNLKNSRKSLDQALTFAVKNDNPEMAKKLLEKGASASDGGPRADPPIFLATSVHMMKFLVAHGARLDSRKAHWKYPGYTLLHLAATEGDLKRIQYLIDHGADVNDSARGEDRPIILAAQYADVPTLELLIKHGANVNSPNKYGLTPLLSASYDGVDENIDCLIEHGADPNVCLNDDRTTPLMVAVENGNDEAVRNLLVGGARVNSKNRQGHTAFDYVDGNEPVIALLKRRGAKPGIGPVSD